MPTASCAFPQVLVLVGTFITSGVSSQTSADSGAHLRIKGDIPKISLEGSDGTVCTFRLVGGTIESSCPIKQPPSPPPQPPSLPPPLPPVSPPAPTGTLFGPIADSASSGYDGSYSGASAYCVSQGYTGICPYSSICPSGVGQLPFWGYAMSTDQWVPALPWGGVETKTWVQVSNAHGYAQVCERISQSHGASYNTFDGWASNGNPAGWSSYLACCN